jgi:hypothetical protein
MLLLVGPNQNILFDVFLGELDETNCNWTKH